MKTAIISDIHSNLAALDSVLAKISALGCDRVVCAGDLVGYATEPNQVIEKVRSVSALTVRGNHDIAVLAPSMAEDFNRFAREAIFWTRQELTSSSTAFLKNLRDQEQLDDMIIAHGSLLDPDEYVFSPFQAARSLEIAPTRMVVVGHTHYPSVYQYEPENGDCRDIFLSEDEEVPLEEGYRYMVNPGSVGQPRDGDWRAAFAVYDDTRSGTVRLYRVEYDVYSTMEKIKSVGLPSLLADRLLEGR